MTKILIYHFARNHFLYFIKIHIKCEFADASSNDAKHARVLQLCAWYLHMYCKHVLYYCFSSSKKLNCKKWNYFDGNLCVLTVIITQSCLIWIEWNAKLNCAWKFLSCQVPLLYAMKIYTALKKDRNRDDFEVLEQCFHT